MCFSNRSNIGWDHCFPETPRNWCPVIPPKLWLLQVERFHEVGAVLKSRGGRDRESVHEVSEETVGEA